LYDSIRIFIFNWYNGKHTQNLKKSSCVSEEEEKKAPKFSRAFKIDLILILIGRKNFFSLLSILASTSISQGHSSCIKHPVLSSFHINELRSLFFLKDISSN